MYLAAVLREHGEECEILDLKLYKYNSVDHCAELTGRVRSFKPDLVGLGCLFSGNFPELLKLSMGCKAEFPSIPIVIGGIHPTIYARQILKNCATVDYVILSEGERSAVEFVEALKNGGLGFEKIGGFAYRKDGEIYINPRANFIEDPDKIPFPAYDLVDLKDYYVDTSKWHNPKKLPINTSVPLISSRSCPNRCNFCSMYMVMGPKWRPRSAKNVVDEIEYVYNKYDHRHFSFMDDNFALNKARAIEICDLIVKRNLNIQFETPNGLSLNTLDEDVLNTLVAAGMVRTGLAIESGSDYIRNKIMGKNLSREKIRQVVDLTRKYKDLFVTAFFIMGMPEETPETLMDTYNMVREIHVDKVLLMNIVPFPCTKLYEQAKRDNLLTDPDTENAYRAADRYFMNTQKFFIKPYKMELSELLEFRNKFEKMLAGQKAVEQNT
jgi:magnesium-protoporphyrin IX monomethyl ester (oxidative) cyclase